MITLHVDIRPAVATEPNVFEGHNLALLTTATLGAPEREVLRRLIERLEEVRDEPGTN